MYFIEALPELGKQGTKRERFITTIDFLQSSEKLKHSNNQEKKEAMIRRPGAHLIFDLLNQIRISRGTYSRLMLVKKYETLEIRGNTNEETKKGRSGAWS